MKNHQRLFFQQKALHEGQNNTNGKVGALVDESFQVKTGEKIRFYVANVGPNELSKLFM